MNRVQHLGVWIENYVIINKEEKNNFNRTIFIFLLARLLFYQDIIIITFLESSSHIVSIKLVNKFKSIENRIFFHFPKRKIKTGKSTSRYSFSFSSYQIVSSIWFILYYPFMHIYVWLSNLKKYSYRKKNST